jgi:hypothetical protein
MLSHYVPPCQEDGTLPKVLSEAMTADPASTTAESGLEDQGVGMGQDLGRLEFRKGPTAVGHEVVIPEARLLSSLDNR